MVNVTIHTDNEKTQEITGQDMVIVTTVNRNGEIGLAMAGGKGVNSKVMLAALIRTTAVITIRTLEGNPEKIKRHLEAAGQSLLEIAGNAEMVKGEKLW